MLELIHHDHPYASIVRPVRLTPGFLPLGEGLLAGPAALDVFSALLLGGEENDVVRDLHTAADFAAETLHGWNTAQRADMRSAWWRSAHRFVVENFHTVDRGREIDELGKLLGVDKPSAT